MNIPAECQLVQLRILSSLLQNLLDEFTSTLNSFASSVKHDEYIISDHLLKEALNHVSVNSAYLRDYQNLNYFINAFNLFNFKNNDDTAESPPLPDFTFQPILQKQLNSKVPLVSSTLSLPKF